MKKTIAVIAVMMALALLLTACAQKQEPITVECFAGNWTVKDSTIHGDPNNLGKFSHITSQFSPAGGIRISGERICQYRDFEYDMFAGDFCTFEVKDGGKLLFHDLASDGFDAIGDFEAEYKLEGGKLTLTQGTTVLVLEKK